MVQIKLIARVRSLGLMLLIAAVWLIDVYSIFIMYVLYLTKYRVINYLSHRCILVLGVVLHVIN